MKTIRLLNYLSEWGDGHILDNGIDSWTRPWNMKAPKLLRCSHSEVWLPDDDGSFEREHHSYPESRTFWYTSDGGDCCTSTMRKPFNGVCRRSASSILRNPDRWTYFEIKLTDEEYKDLVCDIDSAVRNNKGYDKTTILSFFLPFRFGAKDKYICSEICHLWILRHCLSMRLFRNLIKLNCPSPIRLAYNVWRSGHDLYSLETGNVILENPYRLAERQAQVSQINRNLKDPNGKVGP